MKGSSIAALAVGGAVVAGVAVLLKSGGSTLISGGVKTKAAAIEKKYSGAYALAVADSGVVKDVLLALTIQESGGNTNAKRYEAGLHKRVGGTAEQSTSWGLLQILLSTAQAQGYRGSGPGLTVPETGLREGARYFAKMLKGENGNAFNAYRAYNGGPGWRRSSSKAQAMTLKYAESVSAILKKIQA